MKKSNVLWGSFFVLAAVLVILGRTELLAGISVVNIIITVLLIPVIIKSITVANFWGICFPLSLISIMYSDELHLQAFTPIPVLLAALFLSLGLTLLFPKKKSQPNHYNNYANYNNFTNCENNGNSADFNRGEFQ